MDLVEGQEYTHEERQDMKEAVEAYRKSIEARLLSID
jgi:hypothetical protein